MSPGQLLDEKRRDRVRVTWRGDQYELELPAIQADSLIGEDSGVRIASPKFFSNLIYSSGSISDFFSK